MILVTGGAGYIGSHTIIELVKHDKEIVVFDNFINSSPESILRVQKILRQKIAVVNGDIRNKDSLRSLFMKFPISSVVHFAGLKAVGESTQQPIEYYENNVLGSLNLIQVMKEFNCKKLVFSSSATVYGDPEYVPIKENFHLSATNPYGSSKLMVETILRDVVASDSEWAIAILRYFNPVGAHESGQIGEDPRGIPNNLMPYITQVAVGLRSSLNVFGNDYPTIDGTGVRDYIHVVDLAKGHLKALNALQSTRGVLTVNLGTGRGYSVLEVVSAFERASGRNIPYIFTQRRPGDIAQCYADSSYAEKILGWKAEYDLDRMCEDAWRWQSTNPSGYTRK